MNFLQLGQATASQCGARNVALTTMVAQTGQNLQFVNWVAQAWTELQAMHDDWQWLRSSSLLGGGVSFVPAAGVAPVPFGTGPATLGILSTDWGKWVIDSFRNNTTAVGPTDEIFMPNVSFDWWRDTYMYGANRSVRTRPTVFAIAPDMSLCVGPPSNGLYTVTGDYYRAPSVMALDADVPTGLPAQYQYAIVYKAMMYYASYAAAPEVADRGMDGWGEMLTELERLYGPQAFLAGSLI